MVKIQTLRMSQQFQKRESLKDEDDSLEAAFKPRAASPYLHVMSLKIWAASFGQRALALSYQL